MSTGAARLKAVGEEEDLEVFAEMAEKEPPTEDQVPAGPPRA